MASNAFGEIFRITTWGESHGTAIGVIIDGCPSGLDLLTSDIQSDLDLRKPGRNRYVSPRKENDLVEILSGVFEGKTTGAPISLMIQNRNHNSRDYDELKNVLRTGHADLTYKIKYGHVDYRGGGRASARETAARVAAGAVAKKLLMLHDIQTIAYLDSVGDSPKTSDPIISIEEAKKLRDKSSVLCPFEKTSQFIEKQLQEAVEGNESLGGKVFFTTSKLPQGLGDPIYQKLDAKLAFAMLSIPATRGFLLGKTDLSSMKGSKAKDDYQSSNQAFTLTSNYSGGTLGGITTGMPVEGYVLFKPTSSIHKPSKAIVDGQVKTFVPSVKGRHDPCVAVRGALVVEAMLNITLADALLMSKVTRTPDVAQFKNQKVLS